MDDTSSSRPGVRPRLTIGGNRRCRECEPAPAADRAVPPGVVVCRRCGGWARNGRDGRPHGWLNLSVNTPAELGKVGADGERHPYVWCGSFCSVKCLRDHMGDLAVQELLAHTIYTPDPPLSGTWGGGES